MRQSEIRARSREGSYETSMARLQGEIERRWPRATYNIWTEKAGAVKVVCLKFLVNGQRTPVEGRGGSWREALEAVEVARRATFDPHSKQGV